MMKKRMLTPYQTGELRMRGVCKGTGNIKKYDMAIIYNSDKKEAQKS